MIRSSVSSRATAADSLTRISSDKRGILEARTTTAPNGLAAHLNQLQATALVSYLRAVFAPTKPTNMVISSAMKDALAADNFPGIAMPTLVTAVCPLITAEVAKILQEEIPKGTNGAKQALAMLTAASVNNCSADLIALASAAAFWGGGNRAMIRAIYVLSIPANGLIASTWAYTNLPKLASLMEDNHKNQVMAQVGAGSIDGSQLDGVEFGDALNGCTKASADSLMNRYFQSLTMMSEVGESVGLEPLSKHGLELIFAIVALKTLFAAWGESADAWNLLVRDSLTLRGAVLARSVGGRLVPYIPYAYLIVSSMRAGFLTEALTEEVIGTMLNNICAVAAVGQFGDAFVTDKTEGAKIAKDATGSFVNRGMAKLNWYLRQAGPCANFTKGVFAQIREDSNVVRQWVMFNRAGAGNVPEVSVAQLRLGFMGEAGPDGDSE